MKQTVQINDFRDAFRNYNRNENFSHEGLEVLFDYLEEIEDSLGEEMELDVIALCCAYREASPRDIANNYNIDISECEDDDTVQEAVLEYLNSNTSVCGTTADSIIYCSEF